MLRHLVCTKCFQGVEVVTEVKCPSCKKNVKIKSNGHGRCKCGSHVKFINEQK